MLYDMHVHAWVLIALGLIILFLGICIDATPLVAFSCGLGSAALSIFLRLLERD